jgi:hypothetical protein
VEQEITNFTWNKKKGKNKMEIKEITLDGIKNYVEHGIPPGDFLRAFLENDLKEAFFRADDENQKAMFEIVKYCYNEIPHICWGSPEKVRNWIEEKAKERKEKEEHEHSKTTS